MAIGLGKILGINYPENFNHPYLAESITDFWRRWHITLSNFFKQYVYFPMGGSKVSKWRHIFNLLVVWLLTGMWHGNSLNFIIWGLYYFIIIAIEKYFLLEKMKKLPSFFRHLYVIVILLFGYIFFSINDFNDMINFIKILFNFNLPNTAFIFYLKENIVLLLFAILLSLKVPDKLIKLLDNNKICLIISVIIHILLFILVIAYIVSGSYSPFLYNSF
jgi:alginate O-acetyltransferase complex protein AlgI